MSDKSLIERVSAVGIMGNVILVAFKLFAGLVGHSGALISDAVHSLSDLSRLYRRNRFRNAGG